jgi:ribulose-bisphosphate carboxylase large chain
MNYVDIGYKPQPTDVLCSYYLEPAKNKTIQAAAQELCSKATVYQSPGASFSTLAGCAYHFSEHHMKVAFPAGLFEPGNIPQMWAIIAGKIFGLDVIHNLRLQDVQFPEWWIKSFRGPAFGSQIIEKFFDNPARPLVSSFITPEVGLDVDGFCNKATAAFAGGCDIVRDAAQMTHLASNTFEARLKAMQKTAKTAEDKAGLPKIYFPNVSGPGNIVLQRTTFATANGAKGVVLDFQTCGYGILQMLRNEFPELILYGDRTAHAAMARNKRQGISMTTIGKFSRLAGADLIEIGSIKGDMVETETHVVQLHANLLADLFVTRDPDRFNQDWCGQCNSLPVISGGLTAEDIRELRNRFGNEIVLQFGRSMTGTDDKNLTQKVEHFLDELGPLVPLV